MQDQAATLALIHRGKPAGLGYDDWLELSRFGPVLGRWVTLSGYFNEVTAGDYAQAATPDDFHGDYLSERTGTSATGEATEPTARPPGPPPISSFAVQHRARRQLDIAWTLAAFYRGLGGVLNGADASHLVYALG